MSGLAVTFGFGALGTFGVWTGGTLLTSCSDKMSKMSKKQVFGAVVGIVALTTLGLIVCGAGLKYFGASRAQIVQLAGDGFGYLLGCGVALGITGGLTWVARKTIFRDRTRAEELIQIWSQKENVDTRNKLRGMFKCHESGRVKEKLEELGLSLADCKKETAKNRALYYKHNQEAFTLAVAQLEQPG